MRITRAFTLRPLTTSLSHPHLLEQLLSARYNALHRNSAGEHMLTFRSFLGESHEHLLDFLTFKGTDNVGYKLTTAPPKIAGAS